MHLFFLWLVDIVQIPQSQCDLWCVKRLLGSVLVGDHKLELLHSSVHCSSVQKLVILQLVLGSSKNTSQSISAQEEVRLLESNEGILVLLLKDTTLSFEKPLCFVDVGPVQMSRLPLIFDNERRCSVSLSHLDGKLLKRPELKTFENLLEDVQECSLSRVRLSVKKDSSLLLMDASQEELCDRDEDTKVRIVLTISCPSFLFLELLN